MTPVPAPGIASLEAIWTQAGETVENTFHYSLAGAIDVHALQEIILAYTTWASANNVLFLNNCFLVKCQARDLGSSGGASVEENIIPPIQGGGLGEVLPNNATWALKRQTGLRGRANRGRIYMIGLPGSDLDATAQAMVPANAANYPVAYNDLLASMLSDASATEVILHRALGTGTPVLNYVYTDLVVDSQRRRLPNHNRHH